MPSTVIDMCIARLSATMASTTSPLAFTGGKVDDKRAVDLDAPDRQVAQDAQRRVAGAEVVDADGDAQFFQGIEYEQAAFGSL